MPVVCVQRHCLHVQRCQREQYYHQGFWEYMCLKVRFLLYSVLQSHKCLTYMQWHVFFGTEFKIKPFFFLISDTELSSDPTELPALLQPPLQLFFFLFLLLVALRELNNSFWLDSTSSTSTSISAAEKYLFFTPLRENKQFSHGF